ncbi:hypothetical protein HAX54_042731, partial [Datura stramonium]|nr:hypothetical protein [Datura stramonium]
MELKLYNGVRNTKLKLCFGVRNAHLETKEAGRDPVTPYPHIPPAPKGAVRRDLVPPIPPLGSKIRDMEK